MAYNTKAAVFLAMTPCNLAESYQCLDVVDSIQRPKHLSRIVGQDSSVVIVTRYDLDGRGIESRLGARFSAPV
jgi:hypothetical protein